MQRCGLESSGSGSEGQARAREGQRKGYLRDVASFVL